MKDMWKMFWVMLVIIGVVAIFVYKPFGTGTFSVTSSTNKVGIGTGAMAISTFNVVAREKYSNSADVLEGALKVFRAGDNPSDANANPLKTIDVTNGNGKDTNASLVTGTKYRVVWDGSRVGGTSYDIDYGDITFNNGYNQDQALYTFNTDLFPQSAEGIATYGTISDMCDETSQTGTRNCLNDQTNVTAGGATLGSGTAVELYTATPGADAGVTYNESTGDGTYATYLTFACSGSNVECKNLAVDFAWDTSNPPTGNEYSSITAQLDSGKNLNLPQDLLNYWKNEQPIPLGTLKGGDSAIYKITWSIIEANSDANMDYTINVDDLGENNGKDLLLNTKATKDTFTFSGTTL